MEKDQIKLIKKENSMFTNVLTHLKSNGFKMETEILKHEELDQITNLKGEKDGTKFIINLSKSIREDNGNKFINLLIHQDKDNYIKFQPFTNGQLAFIINFYKPEIIKIKEKVKDTKSKK